MDSGRTKIAQGEFAVALGHHAAHAGAGIANGPPQARALHDVLLVLGIGAVLRTLEILQAFPARLRPAECLPVELDVETLGGEVAFLHRDEIIETHALGRDPDAVKAGGHDELLPAIELVDAIFTTKRAGRERRTRMRSLRPLPLPTAR